MTGVEILAAGERATDFELNGFTFILIFTLCIIWGIASGFKDKEYGLGVLIGGIIGIVAGLLAGILVGVTEIEYYPTYKVTISDEVSMNEFTNRYEILEQEGKIYTVKEIMPDAN